MRSSPPLWSMIASTIETSLPPRRIGGVKGCTRDQRQAIAAQAIALGEGFAILGLMLPVKSPLQNDISTVIASIDKVIVGTAAGRRWRMA